MIFYFQKCSTRLFIAQDTVVPIFNRDLCNQRGEVFKLFDIVALEQLIITITIRF